MSELIKLILVYTVIVIACVTYVIKTGGGDE